jgi:uncharacterized protein (UPF0262 family)
MKPSVEKQFKVQIPTPMMGNYTVRLSAVDREMAYAVIEHDNSVVRTAILPATVSNDWMKTMGNKYVTVKFHAVKVQTEVDIQDRVGYVDGKRVYINARNNEMPKILVEW